MTTFLNVARSLTADIDLLKPVRKALRTVEKHREAICARWISGHNNARIEALNGIIQAAKCRARRYKTDNTLINITSCWSRRYRIYANVLDSSKSQSTHGFFGRGINILNSKMLGLIMTAD
ncbi:transposase [Desulfobulbus sp.]|uniref:transposase n=1 Tax=Desulfobulbus sp. TaxID=895 RepID=UPI0027B968D7|nr:transposase [Desulfobulbus sp.]